MNQIQGAWNTLSGSETAAAVNNLGTGDDSAFKGLALTKTQRMYGFGICLAESNYAFWKVPGTIGGVYKRGEVIGWRQDGVTSDAGTLACGDGEVSEQREWLLIYPQRSLVGGFALSLLGSILFTLGQVTLFAILYTLGVIVSLVGTGFLVGFKRQASMAWDPVRRYSAIIFVLCIALVFVFAFAVPIDILVIIFAIFTFLAYAWYSLSFIPYARSLAKKLSPF